MPPKATKKAKRATNKNQPLVGRAASKYLATAAGGNRIQGKLTVEVNRYATAFLHRVVQNAVLATVAARRTTLLPKDLDAALAAEGLGYLGGEGERSRKTGGGKKKKGTKKKPSTALIPYTSQSQLVPAATNMMYGDESEFSSDDYSEDESSDDGYY